MELDNPAHTFSSKGSKVFNLKKKTKNSSFTKEVKYCPVKKRTELNKSLTIQRGINTLI